MRGLLARTLTGRHTSILLAPVISLALGSAARGATSLAPSRDRTLSELNHTSWTAKDGIPGEVRALAQTDDGYLWLGTSKGLYRFDGARFERYEPRAEQRFPSHVVESLLATPNGGLLIGFRNGGASFLNDGQVTIYDESDSNPLGTVRGFAITPNGTVWAAASHGLFRLVGSRWQKVGSEWNYPWNGAQTVFVDRSGTLWVAGSDSIVFLPEGQTQFQRTAEHVFEVNRILQAPDGTIWMGETTRSVRPVAIQRAGKPGPAPPQIIVGSYGVLFDDAGSLWIASLGDGVGRVRFPEKLTNQGTQQFRKAAEVFNQSDGLSSDHVLPVLEDREGNIWVGTSTGLDRFWESNVVPAALPPGSNDMVLITGDHGDLWTGSLNRAFTHLEGRSLTLYQRGANAGITCGYRDNDDSVWLGGPKGIQHFVGGRFFTVPLPPDIQSSWAVSISKGGAGVLWAAFARSGVYRLSKGIWVKYGSQQGLPEDVPTNLFSDSRGWVWLGYLRDRLALLEGKEFRTFTVKDGLAVGDVDTVYEHGQHLWVGGEFGLQLFDEGHFRTISAEDEAKFRGISGIVETSNGDLWVNAADGIARIPATEVLHSLGDPTYRFHFQLFDHRDGLPGTSASLRARPTVVEGTDGRIWFSVSDGVVAMDPNHSRKNLVAPPIYISSITANGKEYASRADLSLPARTKNIRIAFTALSLTIPERVHFRYKLDGVDQDWQESQNRREAFYTNVGPGQHRFQVIASNNDGVWNDAGATLEFKIAPAYYQTISFIALCITTAIVSLYLFYLMRLRQVGHQVRTRMEVRIAERERIARDLHDTLLQSVQGLILKIHAIALQIPATDPTRQGIEKTLDYADRVLAEGRDRVRSLRAATVPAGDLQAAFQKVAEESSPDRTATFKTVVEGSFRELHPMIREESYSIGREAIVNALHHSEGQNIEVEIIYESREFRLRIRDDGRGVDPDVLAKGGRADHWGLPGMRERAHRIGGKLELWSRPGSGTEVELSIPASTAYRSPRRKSTDSGSRISAAG